MFRVIYIMTTFVATVLLITLSFYFSNSPVWANSVITNVATQSPQLPAVNPGESNLPYLYAVFTIVWAAFFAYAFLMSKRERDLRKEIQSLKKLLSEKDKQTSSVERE